MRGGVGTGKSETVAWSSPLHVFCGRVVLHS